MTRRIVVTVAADGTISAESAGRPGPSCLEDIPLIQELCREARIVDSRLTAEYHGSQQVNFDVATIRQEDRS